MIKTNNKKYTSHKKLEIFNDEIQLAPNKIQCKSHTIKHTGKSDHIVNVQFSVKQGEENNISKIQFYVFTEKQLFQWFCNNQNFNRGSFFQNKNNFVYNIKSNNGEYQFQINDDGVMYVIMDNAFWATIPKKISLNIMEEWDEGKSQSDVVTTFPPHDESHKDEIENMIKTSKENLRIISPYIDMTLIKNLIEKKKQGVKVQIILRGNKEIKGLPKDGMNQVKKNFSDSHKLRNDVHARLIIRDDVEVLISSADLTQQSLQNQLNLGIITSDPKVVEKSKTFFQKVWQDTNEL